MRQGAFAENLPLRMLHIGGGEKWRFLLPGTSEPRLEVRTSRA